MTTHTETSAEQLSTADFAAASDRRSEVEATPTMTEGRETVDQTRRPIDQSGEPLGQAREPVERKAADQADVGGGRAALFAGNESEVFRGRWSDIQAGFVDEPRRAVEQADGLVAEVMQRLATVFADERRTLEQQWDRGTDTDTEELRQALQRYRSFFDRLLAM
jgi:hypothetical protein